MTELEQRREESQKKYFDPEPIPAAKPKPKEPTDKKRRSQKKQKREMYVAEDKPEGVNTYTQTDNSLEE